MKTVELATIAPNPANPRIIRDEQFARLVASIKRDPEYLEKRGIVHADGVILGGNMRYRAVQEALKDATFRAMLKARYGIAKQGVIPASWLLDASDWDEEKRRRFVLVDNAPPGMAGDWDWNALSNEWDDLPLVDLGVLREFFDPALNPTFDVKETDAASMAAAQHKLDAQNKRDQDLKSIMCPKCGEEFYVE
jgi:hypothetical protein